MEDWIDITFAYPLPQQWVLTMNTTGQYLVAFMDYEDCRLVWMVEKHETEITHWRKLPERPKKLKQ